MSANPSAMPTDDAQIADIQADRQRRRIRHTEALSQILVRSSILSTQEELRPYESDGLTALKATPLLVVLPETIEQVQAPMKMEQT